MRMLQVRRKAKRRKPTFHRQEYHHLQRLQTSWRRPRGKHSKMRVGERGRGLMPGPGYRAPKAVRGLNAQGLREILVRNPEEAAAVAADAIVIASSVGRRKRLAILKVADEKKLPVVNRRQPRAVRTSV
ncbi:MAG: 50S ribosomal protein L32e [Candidatus Aenigmarchaeota archaeon]|nr:50S ribosomal protein L32e [Candidatus Aenigmarchaeota archaeon]